MQKNRIILILTLLISLFSTNLLADEKLLFSVDLIRHGDRTPLVQLPKSTPAWKEGLGELTEKGIAQEKALGTKLRKLYVEQSHLLPKTYDSNTLYVRSTNMQRTIKSADALLQGLYPPYTRASSSLIPIHVVPKNADTLLLVKSSKNMFSQLNCYLKKRSLWKKEFAPLRNKLNYWAEVTGYPLNNAQQFIGLSDYLYILTLQHRPLPKGISENDANQILTLGESTTVKEFMIKDITDPMGREFLKTVTNYVTSVLRGKETLKYVLFSGHDSSIMTVMNTLQAPLKKLPGYASRLNFSLIENNHKHYVKVTYNDNPVFIPNCGGNLCSLSQFTGIYH